MPAYYTEVPINSLVLDKDNPRIAELLERYDEDNITPELLALALGTSEESYESLKESIRENGGIIHPIVVNKYDNERYVVIEGNTRVQIYRRFLSDNIEGNWSNIRALVYENLDQNSIHKIRLQAHLVGPRDWTPFAQAKYVYHLYYDEHMPMNQIVAFCGGKASRVRDLIGAYNDVQKFYRPACDDDSQVDQRKFSSFIELQRPNVLSALEFYSYTKEDFVKWIQAEKFDRQEHVRNLPEILKSKEAHKVFLREGSDAAIKILNIEEYSTSKLKDVPYNELAYALASRLRDLKHTEVVNLRENTEYADKLNSLLQVSDSLDFILEEINRE